VIILIRIGSPNRLLGLLKPSAAQAVSRLHAPGVNTVLLTGDNQGSATAVGEQLGIRHIVANVLPADKADKVAQLKRDGHTVAMAGDGINDAPALAALAAADVGVAMAFSSVSVISNALLLRRWKPANK
jgi:Cu+-exporting ATPase